MFRDKGKGKALVHKVVCGSGGVASLFSNLGTNWGECATSRPGRFTREEVFRYTHGLGSRVDPSFSPVAGEKRKFSYPVFFAAPHMYF